MDMLNRYVNSINRGSEGAPLSITTDIARCGFWKEPILYTASRLGHESLVKMLLSADPKAKIDINLPEDVRGWTPLIVASVEGRLSIVKLLIAAGANQLKLDRFGWSAREHAAFRGHLRLAALLQTPDNSNPLTTRCVTTTDDRVPTLEAAAFKDGNSLTSRDKSHVLVTLGSPNIREKVNAVDLVTCQGTYIRVLVVVLVLLASQGRLCEP